MKLYRCTNVLKYIYVEFYNIGFCTFEKQNRMKFFHSIKVREA